MATLKGTAFVKIGTQYGRLVNWHKILEASKAKTSFRSVASAIRESAVICIEVLEQKG